jgi:hypothetical protein
MGTWWQQLKPLVTGIDLESEEVRSDDGVLEGVAVGSGSGLRWLALARHHGRSGGAGAPRRCFREDLRPGASAHG